MNNVIVFLCVVASLALYIFVARPLRDKTGKSAQKYYFAKGEVPQDQFANAQTAYGLQMATVYPYFVLAFTGQWWIPIINTGFYTIGILLFWAFLPVFMRRASKLTSGQHTIHAAISFLNDTPSLRRITAILTITAFAGLAVFEITWGAGAIKLLLNGGDLIYYLSISTLALYLVLYVWAGGQEANIRADQYQLFLAYVGLHALVAWVAWQPSVNALQFDFTAIAPLIVLFSGAMLLIRIRITGNDGTPRFIKYLNTLTIVSLVVMLMSLLRMPERLSFSMNQATISGMLSSDYFWLSAISVACLPLFFQFVDMTNWQRLASVKTSEISVLRDARKAIWKYAIESPLSWLLPIFLGLGAAQFLHGRPGEDPWATLLTAVLQSDGWLGTGLAIVVFVGIVAIFLSTAVELLAAIGVTASYDVLPSTRRIVDRHGAAQAANDQKLKAAGKWSFAIATASVVALFIGADYVKGGAGSQLIGFFLSFYTPLVALAPSLVIPVLTGRRAHRIFVQLSLIFGAGAGLACGLWSLLQPTALDGMVTWLAGPIAFLLSWGLYFLGLPFGEKIPAPAIDAPDAPGTANVE